jgi:hypothetical protein
LTIALLAVGLVSHTFVRHVLQATPVLLAGALITRRSPAGRAAALPLLTLWLGLMIAIWLTLSGIVRMVSGRFTGPEVFLTLVIGVACGIGLIASGAAPTMVSVRHRIATSLVFSAFQVGALWLSLQQFAIFR